MLLEDVCFSYKERQKTLYLLNVDKEQIEMKKILALAMLAVSMTATAYSQNGPKTSLKWSYRMSAFNKTYLVGGEDKGGEYNLYICGESMFPDMADEIGILVEYKNVQRFLT